GVSGEAGVAHRDGQLLAELARDTEHLALAGEVQTVAGFDFHGGHAVLEQLLQTALGAGEQIF
nr:hypothetical protein [Tanacetum cinerariifolium]